MIAIALAGLLGTVHPPEATEPKPPSAFVLKLRECEAKGMDMASDKAGWHCTPRDAYFDGCNWRTMLPDGGETSTAMACIQPNIRLDTGVGVLTLDAPPCGTPEAKEWGVCTEWTIRPGMTADRLWKGPGQ